MYYSTMFSILLYYLFALIEKTLSNLIEKVSELLSLSHNLFVG